MFDLIIFDCDGVLVDSEALACDVVAEILAKKGFRVTGDEIADRYAGVSSREMYPQLERRHGKTISQEVRQHIYDETQVALAERLEPVSGILEALEAISLPKCVASGSEANRVQLSLSRTGLLDFFSPHIFTREEVEHGKPAPDLFLYAAGEFQADPGRCLVIEDSSAGVQAGVAAGMHVWGFVGGSHCALNRADTLRTEGAAYVFDAMHQLPAILAEARR